MGAVNIIVIVESIRALIAQNEDSEFNLSAIIAVAAALGMSVDLALASPH